MNNFLSLLDRLAQAQPLQPARLRIFKLEPGLIHDNLSAPVRLSATHQNPTEPGRSPRPRQRRSGR